MKISFPGAVAVAILSLAMWSTARAQAKPEDDLVALVKAYLAKATSNDWSALETLPTVKWAALPPTMLRTCLPDGGCFTRQGAAAIGGRNLVVVASGARSFVTNLYLRNGSTPFGEARVLEALKTAGFTAELGRCPVRQGAGGTNWYRLKNADRNPGVLSIQTSCGGRPCEGFVLSQAEELPPLQPTQVSRYSEQCTAGVAEREPVSRLKPHEHLAEAIVALLTPASGGAVFDWKGLVGRSLGVTWNGGGPKSVDLSALGDPNPFSQSGSVAYAGRKFSVTASGTEAQVKTIRFEEMGLHPRGEHMLGVVYERGIVVRLVRCGPVYTESTDNWYSLSSARTRPAMIRQSIRYDGNTVQDSYELRVDGTLPARDPRDRDPGVKDCR